MSAAAIAALQKLWEKLEFARVVRVVAREPEDILSIEVPKIFTTSTGSYSNGTDYVVNSKRMKDVPVEDRWKARVAWRHFYGFTDGGVYFQKDDYHGLDCEFDQTLNFSKYANHTGGFDKPEAGALICGIIVETEKGKKFDKWFQCSAQFKFLVDTVRNGTLLSENQIAEKLIVGHNPDIYFAIARLVFFDNVQAFVDELKADQPAHPCTGKQFHWDEYKLQGYYHDKKARVIDWTGMRIGKNPAEFLHEVSHNFEPRWWEEFQKLALEQGLGHKHPAYGGRCNACEAEKIEKGDYSSLDFSDMY